LGRTSDVTGLDFNQDNKVDSGDLVWEINHLPPVPPELLAPGDLATSQPLSLKLQWKVSARATSWDLWLWPSSQSRPNVTTTHTLGVTHFQTPMLLPLTDYRWQVLARSADGITTGPQWRFSTAR
jgi:hypothetical protein